MEERLKTPIADFLKTSKGKKYLVENTREWLNKPLLPRTTHLKEDIMNSEIDLIYSIITHKAAFDIGISGILSIRKYENPVWVVEWEEYNNPHDNNSKYEYELLEFDDPRKAAECFVELRHKCRIGEDFNPVGVDGNGYYLLGSELKDFKSKYSK